MISSSNWTELRPGDLAGHKHLFFFRYSDSGEHPAPRASSRPALLQSSAADGVGGGHSGRPYSAEVIDNATDLMHQMGKTPARAKDTPGFIVNRVARPFYNEALRILGDGDATVETIDRIMRLAGNFRMGPFELMD